MPPLRLIKPATIFSNGCITWHCNIPVVVIDRAERVHHSSHPDSMDIYCYFGFQYWHHWDSNLMNGVMLGHLVKCQNCQMYPSLKGHFVPWYTHFNIFMSSYMPRGIKQACTICCIVSGYYSIMSQGLWFRCVISDDLAQLQDIAGCRAVMKLSTHCESVLLQYAITFKSD